MRENNVEISGSILHDKEKIKKRPVAEIKADNEASLF